MCAGSEDEARGSQVQERGGGVQRDRQPRHRAQLPLVIQRHRPEICTKGYCAHQYFWLKVKKVCRKNLEKRLLCGKVLTIFNFGSFSPSRLAKLQTLNTVNCCNPRQIKRHFFWLFRTKGTTNYCDIQLSNNVLIKPNKNKVKVNFFLSQDKGNKSTISWSPDLREEIVRVSCLAVNSVGAQV